MRVVLTGADGFLGWHTRVRLRAAGVHEVVPVGRADWSRLGSSVAEADAVVHVAGVNRGTDDEVEGGNVALARDVARAVGASGRAVRVVHADSIQAGNGTPYGTGKAAAADVLRDAASASGGDLVDLLLPNLFGEHGRPGYNSFVATFCAEIVAGRAPRVVDNPVELLHAQAAAQALVEGLTGPGGTARPPGTPTSVRDVLDTLVGFDELYVAGDLPDLSSPFDLDLFNTLRTASFLRRDPVTPPPRTDHRGRLVEVARVHGGGGHTFVSTTGPGITRGDHFHLRKVERFVVLDGEARISLRRLLDDRVVSFDVSGATPTVIDMPTMWAHNITNTGGGTLTTLFWANEILDPAAPDTFPEPVAARAAATVPSC